MAMKLAVTEDHETMGERAAQVLMEIVSRKPDAALGLTTGNTPLPMYVCLAKARRNGRFQTGRLRVFSTEEYLGAGAGHPKSLYGWLKRVFLDPCEVNDAQVCRMGGEDPEPQISCEHFDQAIRRLGGLDCVVEGIGINGHIGFNEPGTLPEYRSRIVALRPETVRYNRQYWNGSAPDYGMTIGMATILESDTVLLIASGKHKARALRQALIEPATPEVPASFLRHVPHLIVVADREAARLL
jgi:glucosamine-6-phosphate deaminase